MPKPIFNQKNDSITGIDIDSGMHTSMSFWNKSSNGKTKNNSGRSNSSNNIFYDENDNYAEISQAARYFIGGLLEHAFSLAAFVTTTVNSYYRMVPDFEAPVYNAWANQNYGRIVYVATGSAKYPNRPGAIAFGTAKAALVTFAKYIAQEFGRKGITANIVSPGLIETDQKLSYRPYLIWT